MMKRKTLKVQYFAILRESAGMDGEEITTEANTPRELYVELCENRGFSLSDSHLRVAVNGDFSDLDNHLEEGDAVAFIPPVSGG